MAHPDNRKGPAETHGGSTPRSGAGPTPHQVAKRRGCQFYGRAYPDTRAVRQWDLAHRREHHTADAARPCHFDFSHRVTTHGGNVSASRYTHRPERRANGADKQPSVLDHLRAWVSVLLDHSYWSTDRDCRSTYRSGVLLGQWTAKQVRLSGLCVTCWMQESHNGVRGCEGGDCRAFTGLLEQLTEGGR